MYLYIMSKMLHARLNTVPTYIHYSYNRLIPKRWWLLLTIIILPLTLSISFRSYLYKTVGIISSGTGVKHCVCPKLTATWTKPTRTHTSCPSAEQWDSSSSPLYPSQLTYSLTFCFCGVEQGGRHSYSGRARWPGRWVICKICNTTLFTFLSILPFR